jgi:hypothetical protein
MAVTNIGQFEDNTGVFAGQGDLVVFDKVEDYSTAAFATLANPVSLGQIVQNSTSWDGDDPEITTVKDEQGDPITATVTSGTLAFSFEMASTSLKAFEKFMAGEEITISNEGIFKGAKCVGFGTELPVQTLPVGIFNDDLTRLYLYPKAKMVSNLSWSDNLWRIKVSVTCEYLKTATLRTGMILDLASAPSYGTANISA